MHDLFALSAIKETKCLTSLLLFLQEYQFRGIQKAEWNNLFSFIKAKKLKIENVDEVEMGPSGAARPGLDIDLGEDIDTGTALLPKYWQFICR